MPEIVTPAAIAAPAHPWRRMFRTALVVIVAVAPMLPGIIDSAGIPAALPWASGLLAIAAGLTRVLAMPQVELILRRFAPWLSAGDVQSNEVVAQVVQPTGDHAPVVVAGEAHPETTGTPLPIPVSARTRRARAARRRKRIRYPTD
jgi:hypothetical protein